MHALNIAALAMLVMDKSAHSPVHEHCYVSIPIFC